MKSFRVLALSLSALIFTFFLTACGGGGSTPPPPPTPLKITTSLLPNGTVNVPYAVFLQATGGAGTYTWGMSSTSGPLPDGMSLDSTHGSLKGTPTAFGVYKITPQVTDGAGTVATADLTLTIQGALLIKCDSCAQGTANLPPGNPGVPYSQTISASGGKTPFTWCIVETSGNCDDGSQGGLPPGLTISTDNNNGVISGIPTTPGTPKAFTVQVRDSETIVSSGTTNLNITIFDVGPKTMPNGTLNTPYNQPISALGGVGPYTVCIVESDGTCDDGTHGALPPGLSLAICQNNPRPACALTGTPTQQGTTTFTIKATDGENPQASATAQSTITIGPIATNGTLNGQYLFMMNGYKNTTPFLLMGSLSLDGNGHVTDGVIDYNDGTGEANDANFCTPHGLPCPVPQAIQPAGSSYDLTTTGDGLGSMSLETLDSGGNRHLYNFKLSVSGAGCKPDRLKNSCGTFIESDAQSYGSGVIKVQNPPNLNTDAFFVAANLAIGVTGYDASGNRYAAAGALGTNPVTLVDVDCNANGWHLDSCPLDTNDNGNGGSGATVPNPFKGTFSGTVNPTTGRGNFANFSYVSDPNGYCPQGHSCAYVYYIINYGEMALMSTDPTSKPANLTMWTLSRQLSHATGWTVGSLESTNVMELTANDAGKADVVTGILSSSGNGDGTFASDENNGGTLTNQPPSNGTISISSEGNDTGQVQLGGFTQFGSGGAIMYLYNNAAGVAAYVVGTDAKVTAGYMEPQLPTGQGYSNGSVSGNYAGGTVSPAIAAVTNSVTYLHADGVGTAFGTQYTSGSGGSHGPTTIDLTYQVDGTGRGVVKDSQNNTYGYLYVIGPNKVALLPTTSAPAVNVFITGQPD